LRPGWGSEVGKFRSKLIKRRVSKRGPPEEIVFKVVQKKKKSVEGMFSQDGQ